MTLFASGDSQTDRRARGLRAAKPADSTRRSSIRSRTRSSQLEAVAAAERSLRHRPLARRLLPLPDVAAPRRPERDDAPRPARHPGPRPGVRRVPRHAGRFDLRTTNACRCRRRTGRRPCITACRWTSSWRTPSAASTSRSSVASRPRSGPTGRSRSRGGPGCRSGSPPRSTTWTASTSRRRSSRSSTPTTSNFIGEIGPEREERLPRPGPRAALPDRLVGAVRARHDRVHGLRHAGHRLSLRLRAGGDRRGRLGLRRRRHRRSATKAVGRLDELDRGAVRAAFERRFSAERMAHDYLDVYERLIADYRRSHTVPVPMVGEGAAAGV